MRSETYWVIQTPRSERFCAIDYDSGGYPYQVERLRDAKMWLTEEGAEEYKSQFWSPTNSYGANDWEIKKVTLS